MSVAAPAPALGSRPAAGRPPLSLIVVLGALSSFGPLSIDLYLPGLPSLTRGLHASASAAQLTLTGCMLGIGVGQLIAGPLSDRFGRRGPLLIGLAGFTVASVACAVMPSIWPLIAARFVQGLVGGAGIVIARAVVRDLFGGVTAARLFALLMAISGLAPVLAPILGAQILRFTSWRGAFVALAVVGVGIAVMALFGLRETLPGDKRHLGGFRESLAVIRRLALDRGFAPYALAMSLSTCALFAYIAGSSYVLENVWGTSPQVFSAVFAVNSVGFMVVAQVGARFVGRLGPAALLRRGLFGVLAGSLGTLVVALAGAGLWPLLVCLFVLMCSVGLVLPNATAAAMVGVGRPSALGAASALLGFGQFGVGALVVPLVGVGGGHDVLPMAVIMGGASVAAVLVSLGFARLP